VKIGKGKRLIAGTALAAFFKKRHQKLIVAAPLS
jgi:hypothetical protein